MNRWNWAPGLRARLLAALLLTSAVTLTAAALVLLPSLQNRLESQSRQALRGTVRSSGAEIRRALEGDRLKVGAKTSGAAERIANRTGATVTIWNRIPRRVYPSGGDDANVPKEVLTTLRTRDPVASSTPDGTRIALAITPEGGKQFAVELRQSDNAVSDAVAEVRDAFLVAAAIGLFVALLLGLALSTTLSRRLGQLRDGALRLATEGPTAVPPEDDHEDEIGDLSRAFSSMQLALQRQEEARKAFVSTASHELRTPLTSLQGNFELLAEDLENGQVDIADAKKQVEAARSQLRRLSSLASELLDLSQLDAEVELRSEPVELSEIARAVSAEFETRANEHEIELRFTEPNAPVWARADPNSVARILRILIDNALRFAEANEPVAVTVAYAGELATATVSDTGPGIPEPERDAIFERFQRGSMTGGEGGFGLGLAIGRELADRLGGSLVLDETYTDGARFIFALPIEQPS